METNQTIISELLNKIETLKQCLLFYSDDKNYEKDNPIILKDSGHQAKYALELLNYIENYNNDILKSTEEYINEHKIYLEKIQENNNKMENNNKKINELIKIINNKINNE